MGYNIQGGIFKRVLTLFIGVALFSASHGKEMATRDSIGIEEKDGKIFILHEVEPKETVYGLSQRYNTAIADIMAQNPEAKEGLKIGMVLRIPFKKQKQAEPSRKVTHVVEASQTLYSLSKMYNISIEDIKKWNNLPGNELNVGQELVLFTGGRGEQAGVAGESSKGVAQEARKAGTAGKLVHTVERGQTLFSISKMYEVSVSDIKKWNNLSSNELNIGEQLTISVESDPYRYGKKNEGEPTGKKEDTAQIASADTGKEQVAQPETAERVRKPEMPAVAEKTETAKDEKREGEAKVVVKNTNSSGFKKIVELGMAEVIEESSDTKKYVALHKTAPVGTIMQVTNEMNNQNVFVRVIGKLPDTGINDKVLIKISRPAYERLGAVNNRFPAEISYVP